MEMQDLIKPALKFVPKPGTPEFFATLAVAGVGGGFLHVTKPARVALSWVRHPVANYLKAYGGPYTARAASAYLTTSKGVRYVGYAALVADPLVTYHYYRKGEYDKAIISHFGPPGAVYIYGKLVSDGTSEARRPAGPKGEDTRTRRRSKMPEDQRMRMWRMGLRWCKTHKRYDRCSLRARK